MAVRKPRILFLFAHLHKGGMQRAVSNISRALPDYFDQYVGFFGTENPCFEYKAKMHNFNLPGSESIGLFGKLVNSLRRLSVLRSFVAINNIDIVISFGEVANVLNILSRHSSGKVISIRVAIKKSLSEEGIIGAVYRLLIGCLYNRADMIVPVSEGIASELKSVFKIFSEKITVIPNLYNINEIQESSKAVLPDEFLPLFNRPVLLNVGSFCKQKGQDLLLRAFKLVNKKIPESYLVLIGQGPLKDELVQLSQSLDVDSNVAWIDFEENPYRYMGKASVFVLASRYEGFPNVLVEAMICGCPVIAFDCATGPCEILKGGQYGLIVEPENINQLAEKIIEVLTDQTMANHLMKNGKERTNEYANEIVVKYWVRCIKKVINLKRQVELIA